MSDPQLFTLAARARGAITAKLLVAVAVGASVIWSTHIAQAPKAETPADPSSDATTLAKPASPSLAPVSSADDDSKPDPFAGVDVGSNPVLRHIAGIADPARAPREEPAPRAAPTRTPAQAQERVAAVSAAPAPVATPPAQAAIVPETQVEARPAPAPAPAPVQVAVAPAPAPAPVARPAAPVETVMPVVVEPAAIITEATAVVTQPAEGTATAAARDAFGLPPSVQAPLRTVRRTVPVFPQEAIKAGIKTGRVTARVTIEADGRVSASQIVSATPAGFFERESQRALGTWRYDAPGRVTSTDVELVFARE